MKSNVEIVFYELISKKLIDHKIRLIPKSHTPNYKASITKKNVYYNPSFSHINKDGIRFIILHEVGHMQKFQMSYLALIVSSALSLLLYFLIIFSLGLIYTTLLMFAVFILVFRLFTPLIKNDELQADAWATRQILAGYSSKKPSLMMKKAWKDVLETKYSFNIWRVILMSLSKLIPYHPTYEERIINIISIEKERFN